MENNEINSKYQEILIFLDMIYQNQKKIDERMDCLLHAVCESNDKKTHETIKKYLLSEYRSTRY